MYWSMLELGLSIVAACLPTLRPLVQNLSVQVFYESLRSYIKIRSKSSSTRPGDYSNFDDGPSTDPHKVLKRRSSSSQTGLFVPGVARMATSIYPMQDVEAQTGVPSASIKIQSKIEQTSYMQ